jgi:hypothetical protein
VPNGTQNFFKYYYLRQNQDVALSNAQNAEVPQYFLDAFALAIAYRLALIWAVERAGPLKTLADEAWNIASTQNVETNNLYLTPTITGYFR